MTKKQKISFLELLDNLELEQEFFQDALSNHEVNQELLDSAAAMVGYLEDAWHERPLDMSDEEQDRLATLLAHARHLQSRISLLLLTHNDFEQEDYVVGRA